MSPLGMRSSCMAKGMARRPLHTPCRRHPQEGRGQHFDLTAARQRLIGPRGLEKDSGSRRSDRLGRAGRGAAMPGRARKRQVLQGTLWVVHQLGVWVLTQPLRDTQHGRDSWRTAVSSHQFPTVDNSARCRRDVATALAARTVVWRSSYIRGGKFSL